MIKVCLQPYHAFNDLTIMATGLFDGKKGDEQVNEINYQDLKQSIYISDVHIYLGCNSCDHILIIFVRKNVTVGDYIVKLIF